MTESKEEMELLYMTATAWSVIKKLRPHTHLTDMKLSIAKSVTNKQSTKLQKYAVYVRLNPLYESQYNQIQPCRY